LTEADSGRVLWSGRFDVEPNRALLAWGASFSFDRRLFEDDVTGSLALAEALARANVLTPAEAQSIQRGLAAILEQGRTDPSFLAGTDEDVHSFVERVLIERIGEPGRKLHTGRSRNDQVAVDMRLYVRRRVPDIQRSLTAVVGALLAQAVSAGDAVMPSYTHLRRAQPVLAAHYLLAHAVARAATWTASPSCGPRPTRCRWAPAPSPAPLRRGHGPRGVAGLHQGREPTASTPAADRDS
jgi:argininosuccinate lyase